MTVSSASNVGQTDYAAMAQAQNARPQAPPPQPQAKAGDTVEISSAARQAIAQKPAEATETPAQTTQEAAAGDPMAMAKVAKEQSSLQ